MKLQPEDVLLEEGLPEESLHEEGLPEDVLRNSNEDVLHEEVLHKHSQKNRAAEATLSLLLCYTFKHYA